MPRTRDDDLHERRRSEVLDAAARCFAGRGIHPATMQDICAAAGLSPGGLYRYFPGKDAIVVALAERELAEVRTAAASLGEATEVVDAILALVPAAVETAARQDYGRLMVELTAEALRNPRVAELFARAEQDLFEALSAAIARGQRRGEIDRGVDGEVAAFTLMAILDGIALNAAFEPDLPAERIAEGLRASVAAMLAAPRA